MSTSTPEFRSVRNWLRDRYGATDIHLEHGGKHGKLVFTINGKTIDHTFGHRAGSHDPVAIANQSKQQLRRLLGETAMTTLAALQPVTGELPPSITAAVTVAKAAATLRSYDVNLGLSHLADSSRVVLIIDRELYHAFAHERGLRARYADGMFVFTKRPEVKTPSFYPTEDGRYKTQIHVPLVPLASFGRRTPAIADLVDDGSSIQVLVDPNQMVPLRGHGERVMRPAVAADINETRLRAVLDEVRRIEAETPFRLTRSRAGAWAFAAPVIT